MTIFKYYFFKIVRKWQKHIYIENNLSNFATQIVFMLSTLISSKTRVKLLLKFFLNSNTRSYLRSLETEFGESTNAIRIEINRFEQAGMLSSEVIGNKKMFRANVEHPLFTEIHNILLKYVGLDRIVEDVIERLGEVRRVYVVGEFSKGLDSGLIDLVLVGNIDTNYLVSLIEKTEKLVSRKIRYIIYSETEFLQSKTDQLNPKPLLLWSKDWNIFFKANVIIYLPPNYTNCYKLKKDNI